jgi:hypothetical protein
MKNKKPMALANAIGLIDGLSKRVQALHKPPARDVMATQMVCISQIASVVWIVWNAIVKSCNDFDA